MLKVYWLQYTNQEPPELVRGLSHQLKVPFPIWVPKRWCLQLSELIREQEVNPPDWSSINGMVAKSTKSGIIHPYIKKRTLK